MKIFSTINNKTKKFELKRQESKKIEGLTITNKSGGHEILTDSGDTPFAEIELKISNKKETIYATSLKQKLWKDYLIIFDEVGWDGEFVKFQIKKVGKPKINTNQALNMAQVYCRSKLKIKPKEMANIQMNLSDLEGYYSIGISFSEDIKKNSDIIALSIDKFTGKITKTN